LSQLILSHGPEQVAAWTDSLHEAFGDQGQLVADVIPELAFLLGPLPPVPPLPPDEQLNR
jgi:predicted ATPase